MIQQSTSIHCGRLQTTITGNRYQSTRFHSNRYEKILHDRWNKRLVCSKYKCTDKRDRGAAREYCGNQSRDVTQLAGIRLAPVLKHHTIGKAGLVHFDTLQRRSALGAHLMWDSVDTRSIRMLCRKGTISAFPGGWTPLVEPFTVRNIWNWYEKQNT